MPASTPSGSERGGAGLRFATNWSVRSSPDSRVLSRERTPDARFRHRLARVSDECFATPALAGECCFRPVAAAWSRVLLRRQTRSAASADRGLSAWLLERRSGCGSFATTIRCCSVGSGRVVPQSLGPRSGSLARDPSIGEHSVTGRPGRPTRSAAADNPSRRLPLRSAIGERQRQPGTRDCRLWQTQNELQRPAPLCFDPVLERLDGARSPPRGRDRFYRRADAGRAALRDDRSVQ
jgi:hypothetical protein